MPVIDGSGNRQHATDRPDPVRDAVMIDKRDHRLNRRSSFAGAKYTLAIRNISLACRSSRSRVIAHLASRPYLSKRPPARHCRTRPSSPTLEVPAPRSRSSRLPTSRLTSVTDNHSCDSKPYAPPGHEPQVKFVRCLADNRPLLSEVAAPENFGAVQKRQTTFVQYVKRQPCITMKNSIIAGRV